MAGGNITREDPGLILFLLDRSLSMGQPIATPDGETATAKHVVAARAVNQTIYNIVLASVKESGQPPRPYFDIGVLAYGDVVENAFGDNLGVISLPDLTRLASTNDADGTPIWVEPLATGKRTVMASAFFEAGGLARGWADDHPRSFPPVVINVSDGECNEPYPPEGKEVEDWADLLTRVSTEYGNLVLFNVTLATEGSASGSSVVFPTDEGEIDSQWGRSMFSISSVLPPEMVEYASQLSVPVHPTSRAFAFNAGVEQLTKMLDIGTRVLTTEVSG